MNNELIVIIILSSMIIFQQIFYARQVQKFADKIMSGSYANYAQSQALVNESMKPQQGFSVQLPQDEELDELARLNAMIKPPF